jgi:uncharacterized protein with PhoU and TrkA domain
MPSYRVFRLKENLRAHFRQLPHLSGVAQLKLKDYVEGVEVIASHRYAAWHELKDTNDPLEVGDVLVEDGANLYVVKFVGLEPAEWIVPEVKPQVDSEIAAVV